MFRRVADHLRDRHPERVLAFDRTWSATRCDVDAIIQVRDLLGPQQQHLLFWLAVVFFEELTIYMHHRLRHEPGLQPCWRAVHEAHMREEVQHVLTDRAHIGAIRVAATDRAFACDKLLEMIDGELLRSFGLRVALPLVAELFPEMGEVEPRPIAETRVHRDVYGHPIFRRTREGLGLPAQPEVAR
jgi:hypothetical protein